MELRDYLRVLRKGWALILAFVILGVGAGIGLTLITKKSYQSTAEIFVDATQAADTQQSQAGNQYVTNLVQSLVSVANAPGVTAPVIKDLKLKLSNSDLASKISATAPLNKVLIDITVSDHDPVESTRLANAVATQFTVYVGTDVVPKDPTTNTAVVKLTVTKPALVPSAPTSPKKVVNVALGLVVGLILGVGLAVLFEILDNTVKNASDFEPFGVPVLGVVPFDKRTQKTPVAFRGDPHSSRSESYRQIRTNLQFVDVDNPPRIIAVSSAIPGEGKSTTAINLAAALAEAGARVCLVEADLRRPSIASVLGLVADVGFTTVVIGKAPVETVLQNAGRNLAVLTSGPIPPNPSELLLSKHAKQVIFDIAAKVDFTIIDTPPLLPVTDGAEIATVADGMILVHRAGKTTRDQALRAMEALDKVGKKPIGVVLNMITRQGGKYDYEYGYSYAAYRPSANAKKKGGPSTIEPPVGDSFEPESPVVVAPPALIVPEAAPASGAAHQTRQDRRRRSKAGPLSPAGTAGTASPVSPAGPGNQDAAVGIDAPAPVGGPVGPATPPQAHFGPDGRLTTAAGAPGTPGAPASAPVNGTGASIGGTANNVSSAGQDAAPYVPAQANGGPVVLPPLVPNFPGLPNTAGDASPIFPPVGPEAAQDEPGAPPPPQPLWFRPNEPR